MFVLKSTHQKALDEIDLLRTELAVARTAERSIDERLVTVRESHNKLIHENACLTALCQYLPAGVYHIHYDASHTFGRKTSHVVYNTSVTVDHKAAKNANRNYTIVHEPLTRIVKQDELTDQLLTLVARQEFVKVKRDRVYKRSACVSLMVLPWDYTSHS